MGISFHSSQSTNPHKMVAAQVIKLLWAASLAVAAPQLDFGDQRSVQRQVTTTSVSNNNINQDQVVTEVVGVLQPQIARAVAEALAAYSATSSVSSSSSSSSTGFASGSSRNSGEDVNARAEYNFEYKVADEAEQTYISQQESRDGDQLTGSYSYVDPNGALVTVNYEAGAMGFSATTDKQDGFLSINSRNTATSSAGAASGSRSRTSSSSSSSSSSLDQNALIAQIISALQPQISSAVQSALASSSSVSRSTVLQEAPRISSSSGRSSSIGSGGVEGTFGNGVSVSIDTPEYNIAY